MKIGGYLLAFFCLILSVVFLRIEISDEQNAETAMLLADGSGVGPIAVIEPGAAAFIGETERGPQAPQVITSFEDYEKIYGGYTGRSFIPYSVRGYFENGGSKLYVARVISGTAQTASLKLKCGGKSSFTLNALNGGGWGNRIAVRVGAGKNSTVDTPTFRLEVYWFTYNKFSSVKSGKPDISTADIAEIYDDVSKEDGSPYHFQSTVNGCSSLIRITVENDDTGLLPDPGEKILWCSGGSDGDQPVLADFSGTGAAGNSQGLDALSAINDIATIYSPLSFAVEGLDKALTSQCELLQDRTVIFDTALKDLNPDPWSSIESSFAACYTPWVQVAGFDSKDVMIPPGGYIAGVYAENNPAMGLNLSISSPVLHGVKGVGRNLSEQEQEALAVRKINPIIPLSEAEYAVTGDYTLSGMLDDYKDIRLRRYVNYLFRTFSSELDWTKGRILEPELRKQIKLSIEDFLDTEWRRGILKGKSQIEAYYVKIDDQTGKTRDNIKQTAVIEVGVAVENPSEYFTFIISK